MLNLGLDTKFVRETLDETLPMTLWTRQQDWTLAV